MTELRGSASEIHGELPASSGDVLAIARALVRVPSVNPTLEDGGAGESEIAEFCNGLLTDWGFATSSVEVAEGRWNVVARVGDGSPVTLLNGHLDTVGTAGMSIDPFGAVVRGGRLWGRGAADMKGGVACILAAAHRFVRSQAVGRGSLVVALTADEEHASVGMQALVREPLEATRAVVCEPTDLAVMPAHKGFLWLTARFYGVAAHGSRPEFGVDAVRHAGLYIAALEELQDELAGRDPHPLLGVPSFHFGRIQGGAAPSVYPDHCSVEIERRTLPSEGPEVDEEFARVLDELSERQALQAKLAFDLYRPGSDVPPDTPLVTELLAALDAEGLPTTVAGMTAWVDAAYLNEIGIPAVCFGPGSIEQAHTASESVPIEQLYACTAVLARFLGV